MSFLSRLRATSFPSDSDGAPGGDANIEPVEGLSEAEVARAAHLRAELDEDPNDAAAFGELAELVRRNASAIAKADPLTADSETAEPTRDADLAVWALAEELGGSPKAWYPLLELARLSLPGDSESALHRLDAAVERDDSGQALTLAARLLREAGRPDEAYNLGVAHWRPAQQDPAAGAEVILAAVEAGRPLDAKRALADLDEAGAERAEVREVADRLRDVVAQALDAQQQN